MSERITSNEVGNIDEAYANLGYAIVNDACEEWLTCVKGIRKLEKRAKEKGLTEWDKVHLSRLEGAMCQTEKWFYGDFCYMLCGIEGDVIMEGLRKRVSEW